MRVLICGSRGWRDPDPMHMLFAQAMGECIAKGERLVVIHGGAKGADELGGYLAKRQYNAEVIVEEADWKRYGAGAGPKRNQKMLDEHKPDQVWAFRSHGKSNGTDDMVQKARAANVTTIVTKEVISYETFTYPGRST